MKPFILPILAGLVLASCDSSTMQADGTSSETQTSLQALADNVRSVPSPRVSSVPNEIASIAARRLGGFVCPRYEQRESYWPDRSAGLGWDVDRSETRSCGADSAVVSVFGMYRKLEDSSVWTRHGVVTVFPAGNLVRRTRFETSFGGGFRIRFVEVERLNGSGGPEGENPYQLVEIVLTDDRVEADLLSGEFVTKAGVPTTRTNPDVYAYRSAIVDLRNGRDLIGYVYQTEGRSIEVRDLQGRIVVPRLGVRGSQPDSMGLRLVSTRNGADSDLVSLRLQLAESSEFLPASSALVLLDSVVAASWNQAPSRDSIPSDVPALQLGTASFAQPRRLDWRLPSSQDGARIGLLRRYPGADGFGPWRLVALVRLDGQVVAP